MNPTDEELDRFGDLKRAYAARETAKRISQESELQKYLRKPRATPPLADMLRQRDYTISEVRKRRQEIAQLAQCGDDPNYDQICSYHVRDLLWLIEQLLTERGE